MFDWKPGEMGWVTADGKRLEATCLGPAPGGGKPTIVMLHEGLGCVTLWRDFPERVQKATGCGVFVYSRAGYGRSDAAELPKSVDFMDGEALDVLHVPGHSPDSVAFFRRGPGMVISGDVMFAGGSGRTDFPGGDAEVLRASVRETLFPLGDEIDVFPGHGPATTIGAERETNPYFA